ncbi:MAG: DUF4339 domain-containing protein [Chitinophagaceae bacterium]|nr:MAG: DUF4339 domain-containing protein [Chitinophagaceae bacterium]
MTSYFIHDGLNHSGPFSLHELKEKIIVAETPVWTEGLGDWATAKEIPELVNFFNLRPTPPPFQGTRKPGIAVVPAFNTVREPESYNEYKPATELRGQNSPVSVVPEYEQDLYQMEMENYFMEDSHRGRNQLGIAAAVIILGSLTFWLVKLMSA